MKICIFNVTSTMDRIGSEEVGGLETYTFRLGEALTKRGHEVTLYGGRPKAGKSFSAPRFAVKLFPYVETRRIPDLGTRFQRLAQRLHFAWSARKDFFMENFDVVLVFKPYDLVTAWFWRRRGLRTRFILSVHGPEFYAGDRFFSKSVDAMYAVSHSTARAVEERYRVACPVIPNFIDLEQFPFHDRPNPPREKLVVAVGRLVKQKGILLLVRVFARLRAKMPEARLVVIGDGPEKARLMEETRRLGTESAVEFTGVLKEADLFSFYSRAWLFVQPSIGYESFSISTLEALAYGLAVLASDQVGITEWFRESSVMEIYRAGNEKELEDGIHKLLTQPWEAARGRALEARKIVEMKFGADRVAEQIEKFLLKDGGVKRENGVEYRVPA